MKSWGGEALCGRHFLRLIDGRESRTENTIEEDFKPLASLGAKFGKAEGNVAFTRQCCSHGWFSPVANNCIWF